MWPLHSLFYFPITLQCLGLAFILNGRIWNYPLRQTAQLHGSWLLPCTEPNNRTHVERPHLFLCTDHAPLVFLTEISWALEPGPFVTRWILSYRPMPPDFLISPVDINNLNSAFLEATFFLFTFTLWSNLEPQNKSKKHPLLLLRSCMYSLV